MEKQDFPVLTGIRLIAATLVFISHYADNLIPSHGFLYVFARQLNIGVNLFFVLSGFLITYRYYDNLFSAKNFRFFILKRIARIFPLYLLIFCIHAILLSVNGNGPGAWNVFLNITLFKGLSETYYLSGIAQSWSLTVEEMFYFFAPFSFYLIKSKKFFLLQIPVLIGAGLLAVVLFSKFPFEGFFHTPAFMFSTTFFGRCFEFFVGIYIALLLRNNVGPAGFKNYTLLGSCLLAFFLLALSAYAYTSNKVTVNDTIAGTLLFNFFIPVSIGVLYYGLLLENSIVKRSLSRDWVVLLGKSSYAFYLIHIGMIAEVIYFHFTSSILLLYIGLQLLSVAAYRLFEKPVYFFILRKFAPQRHKLSPL